MNRGKVGLIRASAVLLQVAADQLEEIDQAEWGEQYPVSLKLVKVARELLNQVEGEEPEVEEEEEPEAPPPAQPEKPSKRPR
jgi:hypothetical protein